MARIPIPVTAITVAGATQPSQTNADATNKHSLSNPNSRTIIEVVSSDAGSQTVAFQLAGTALASLLDGAPTPVLTETIAAGATRYFGPFGRDKYNSATALSADQTITSDGTAPANNDTVTIDGHVYTFKTTLTGAANEVLIGANAAAALTNLKSAINATSGAGTTYGTGTVAHTAVSATTLTSTTLLVVARTAGAAANAIATTETSSHLSWGAATLAGGADASSVVLIDPSVSTTLKFRAYSS